MSDDLTLETYIEHITQGHAFTKHALGIDKDEDMKGVNAFRATANNLGQSLGQDLYIETPDDMAHYIQNRFINHPNTIGYVSPIDGSVNLYNPDDNVVVSFSPRNGDRDLGTMFRYENTQQNFLKSYNRAKTLPGPFPFQEIDNTSPGGVRNAVQGLVDDINARPQMYLRNQNNPASTVQNRVLAEANRPGRGWELDEVARPVNNIKGHSAAYAVANNLDIDPKDYINIADHVANQIDVKTMRREMGKAAPLVQGSGDAMQKLYDDVAAKKILAKLADLGEKGVVTALVASGLNVMLTKSAIAGQREMAGIARDLPPNDPRHITQDQYDEYINIMDELEPRMLSEAADPFFATSTAQAIANEAASYEMYNNFIAQNHTLDPELAENLRPGLIKIDTTMEILRDRTIEALRDDPANLPPSMQNLAASMREVEAANLEFQNAMLRNTPPKFSALEDTELIALSQPEVQQSIARLDQAIHGMHNEFINTLQSPDGAHFVMSQLSNQELLQVVERTARFDKALDVGSELRAYSVHSAGEKILLERVDCIGSSPEETMECAMFIARKEQLEQALLDNPDAMRDYLENKFVPQENRPASIYDMSAEQITRIESSEVYIKMAIPLANMRDGLDNLPSQMNELTLSVKHADFYTDNKDLQNARDLAAARFPSEMGQIQAGIQQEIETLARQREYEARQIEIKRQAFEQWQQQQNSAPVANNTQHQMATGL
ncbi:MAG: hypothetical protein OEY94_06795 [Alphaproteobacteria bacterium]|nr:hypothetical protein [Alphaproteobacteria bacterium]